MADKPLPWHIPRNAREEDSFYAAHGEHSYERRHVAREEDINAFCREHRDAVGGWAYSMRSHIHTYHMIVLLDLTDPMGSAFWMNLQNQERRTGSVEMVIRNSPRIGLMRVARGPEEARAVRTVLYMNPRHNEMTSAMLDHSDYHRNPFILVVTGGVVRLNTLNPIVRRTP